MENTVTENVVLRDWLTFTSVRDKDPQTFIDALGLNHVSWVESTGWYGYRSCLRFGGIGIHYDGREDMGICCEMSGSGCRSFEDNTSLSGQWDDLLGYIFKHGLNVTRLDMAFDDHTGILDINRIAEDVRCQRYVSRFRKWMVEESDEGLCCRVGSYKSDSMVRIYDKARERGITDGQHWVRVEMQLRDDRAFAFLNSMYHAEMPIGELFAGVLLNYLRFVEPCEEDSNKSRWKMTEYWARLIDDASRIRLLVAPGEEYNEERCRHYVVDIAGNAIATMIEIAGGPDEFANMINARSCAPNPKYEIILNEHHARLQEFEKRVAEQLHLEESLVEIKPGIYQAPVSEMEEWHTFIHRYGAELDSKEHYEEYNGYRD